LLSAKNIDLLAANTDGRLPSASASACSKNAHFRQSLIVKKCDALMYSVKNGSKDELAIEVTGA